MRVLSYPVHGWADPGVVFERVYGEHAHAAWLDSGVHAVSGMSVMGSAARVFTASVADEVVVVDGAVSGGTAFDFLKRELQGPPVAGTGGFPLGWVGWLGYELASQTMQSAATQRSRYPDAALIFLDRAITFDHAAQSISLVALGDAWEGELLVWRDTVLEQLDAARRRAEPGGFSSERWSTPDSPESVASRSNRSAETGTSRGIRWAYTDDQYLAMIRDCQSAIRAGDAYQLCLTTEVRIAVHPDPLTAYAALRASSPTHHGAFLRMGEVSLLSSSPEQFLAVSPSGDVQTKPIKGTRRRGSNPQEDASLRDELLASDKERAENLMIVDLMRNDIGRIAELGSVRVTELLAIESYAQVHQLVSTVRGRLASGLTGIDAVVSCFPAGSMTGAPKRSATEILDRLEQRPRGIYSGALGYFGLDGSIDLSMVIRSIVLDADGATVGAGGGITALSVPEEELAEVYLKAAALLRVLGADVAP